MLNQNVDSIMNKSDRHLWLELLVIFGLICLSVENSSIVQTAIGIGSLLGFPWEKYEKALPSLMVWGTA